MTNREIALLITTVVFISTTIGLAFKVSCEHHGGFGEPRFENGFQEHGKDFGDKKFDDKSHGPNRMMTETDTNKDGQLTKDEMLASHTKRMDEMFKDLDTNKDGKLSSDELSKGREKMRAKMMKKFEDDDHKSDVSPEGKHD